MEEILIYNTPTSEKIITEINEFQFKKVWKKNLAQNNKNLYWAIAIFLLGLIPLLTEPFYIGTFCLGYSILAVANYFNYRSVYQKNKKLFHENLGKEIESLNRNSKDVFWEYTPEYFRFKNYKHDLKFNWEDISYQIVDEKYLYITAMHSLAFILDKVNIDEINLEKTLKYLGNKATMKVI